MKKHIRTIITVLIIMLVACIIPFPNSNVNLNLYFEKLDTDNLEEGSFRVYYTTAEDPSFSERQTVHGIIDKENNKVSFRFDSEYADKISVIRIDFPPASDTLCINGMSVSSGGFTQKQIDPSKFITEANIISTYDIKKLDSVETAHSVYIVTGEEDPLLVLSDFASAYIISKQSKHIGSRLLIFALMSLGLFFTKKIKW